MGEFLPTFVTSTTTRFRKIKLDPSVRSLDATVTACKDLAAESRASWAGFYRAWRAFYDAPDSFWTASSEVDVAEDYERQFADWQEFVAKECPLSEPKIRAPEKPGATLRTVAISGALIAGSIALVWGLVEVSPLLHVVRERGES